MSQLVLGLDSSCYTTSLAAVDLQGQPVTNLRKLLPVEMGQRGLRQSDAVFIHIRQYQELLEAFRKARNVDDRILAICASSRPRMQEDSYMPVFQVGDTLGQGMAAALGVPFFTTGHQQGHVAAALYGTSIDAESDFLALHLSGGTTEMLSVRNGDMTLIGGSADLHAGQLVDRCGVMLGLPFPSGPYLEQLAVNGRSEARLPASFDRNDRCYCHFSGAENGLRKLNENGLSREDQACEVYDLLARTVAGIVLAGVRKTGIHEVLMAGGVASSFLFRQMVTARIRKADRSLMPVFGKAEYSGDNAVGVALIGLKQLKQQEEHSDGSTDSGR